MPPGYALSVPWQPLPAQGGVQRYRIALTPLDWAAMAAVGRFREMPVTLPGGTLRVALLDGGTAAQRQALRAWLARVSQAVLDAYGRLPIPDVQVLVVPVSRRRGDDAVAFGQSTRGQGHALTLLVDPAAPPEAFARDWIAVHELSHLFHPYLGDEGRWLAEGLATYYQEVLRARAGLISAESAWQRLDAGFARGRADAHAGMPLAEVSERMMDLGAFMRVYWAGTAYWLDVDAALRRHSRGRLSVDVALARFRDCCLPSHRAWTPQAFVAKLDTLTGTDLFTRDYARFAGATAFPDLAPTYAALGLRTRTDGALRFGGDATAEALRTAIMAAPGSGNAASAAARQP
uniref:Peptidase M61 catalytic domain-containing protein n=1 Tax=Mizugakiibacter sediminis TaxID=1475481 RepID=A0A0U1P9I2_9GAMM